MFMRKWHDTTIMCHYFGDDVRLCEGLQFHWITQDLLLWGSGLERLLCALLAASFHNIILVTWNAHYTSLISSITVLLSRIIIIVKAWIMVAS